VEIHFHTLLLDGIFFKGPRAAFLALSPLTDEEVGGVLARIAVRVQRLLRRGGCMIADGVQADPLVDGSRALPPPPKPGHDVDLAVGRDPDSVRRPISTSTMGPSGIATGPSGKTLRWAFVGSGITHPNFLATVGRLGQGLHEKLDAVAPAFCESRASRSQAVLGVGPGSGAAQDPRS
jgi:hypothetical protein